MITANHIRIAMKNMPKLIALLASARAALGEVEVAKLRKMMPIIGRRTSPMTYAAFFGAGVVTGAVIPTRGKTL